MRTRNRSILELPESIETVDDAFLAALRTDGGEVEWPSAEDLRDLGARLAAWQVEARPDAEACRRVTFRLMAPSSADGAWRIEAVAPWRDPAALRALGLACRTCPSLRGMADREMELPPEELRPFLEEGVPALRSAGYAVELPGGMSVGTSADVELVPLDRKEPADMSSAAIVAKATVRIGGEKATRDEIAFLLDQGGSVVFFRGRWIEVDRNVLKSALKVLDADGRRMSGREAVAFSFGLQRRRGLAAVRAKGGGWFGKVLETLRTGEGFRILPQPKGFKGRLRAYQRRGYSWMTYLTAHGFGALLADDMGLGKTAQTIAWMLKRREAGGGRVLVVAPVSVTMNWVREMRRFAPGMGAVLHQGRDRLCGGSFSRAVSGVGAVVVGYPVFVKDFRMLADAGFDALVLDEAQTIKNPDTRAARAARSFPCIDRVALTGTPFENRATDLWSLEEFLNAGLLGSRSEFAEEFEKPLRDGNRALVSAGLKKTLAPFLLRRLKTDPGIAAELGPKREIREYCMLTPRQRAAYEAALARYACAPRGSRGAALALLTELKLVCDGLGSDGSVHGGKEMRLMELLESVFNGGESALVFTQYVKVAERLKSEMERRFARRIPFLHGGQQQSAREAQIEAFNSSEKPTAFVLSLKAGGFGLNLAKATHVIHYDRWWNPATESQATDRAHRIGQTRTVFVHLLISNGTLEDRIDGMLEEKRKTAGELVESGESMLLKMGEAAFARAVGLEG